MSDLTREELEILRNFRNLVKKKNQKVKVVQAVPPFELVSISPDFDIRRVKASSEIIKAPRGVKRVVKKTRTVRFSFQEQVKERIGESLSLDLGALSASIKDEMEKQYGTNFQESRAVEQTVEIDGNIHQTFELIWYDLFRDVEVTYLEYGTRKNINFSFQEGSELDIVEI